MHFEYYTVILGNNKNVENIQEFLVYLVYFGLLVSFSVSFTKFLDIRNQGKYTGLVLKSESPKSPKYQESRNAKNCRQTHGLITYLGRPKTLFKSVYQSATNTVQPQLAYGQNCQKMKLKKNICYFEKNIYFV